MIEWRNLAFGLLVAFAMTAGVYADMMPISGVDPSSAGASGGCNRANGGPSDAGSLFYEFGAPRVGLLPFASFAPLHVEAESVDSAGPALRVLSHDQSSFDLCLYALVGLGLCRSGRWVRKASLGFVPDWYHGGGPFQIGHSYAVSPDTLCPVPACCFIQPDGTPDHSLPPCRTDATVSLRHPSQHTPDSLISRGPPLA